jgi:hypothetical protein
MIKFCHVLPCLVFFAAGPAFAQATYAPSVTLLQGNITYTVHWDGSYDYEEAVTQRLNTGAAVQDSGQTYIYYNGSSDNVTLLNAYTLTPAGQRLDVLPENILDQRDGSAGDTYTDGGRKVLIFPGLSPGAVEHYHYIIKDIGTYFPGQFFAEENFPVSSATQSASVTITAPPHSACFSRR